MALEQDLRAIPVFRNLPGPALVALTGRLRLERHPRGRVLFRRGDPSDAMYLVQSGRVDVLLGGDASPGGGGEPVASLGPGSFVGELGLLLDEPRSATLVVAADAELWALGREALAHLLAEFPVLAVDLTRELGRRLVATNRRMAPGAVTRFTAVWGRGAGALAGALQAVGAGRVGILPLDDAATGEVPDGARLLPGEQVDGASLAAWAGTHVEGLDHLLVVLSDRATPAARGAVAAADHLVAFVTGHPGWALPGGRRHRVVPCDGSAAALRRAARRVAGQAVGLALSSGGSKSLAHVGVIRALTRAGIEIDAVAGTSGGALAAAGLAFAVPEERVLEWGRELARHTRLRRFDVNLVPRSALFKGVRLRNLFDAWLEGRSFADAAIPLWAVATDVATGEEVVIGEGPVADGLRASMSIPGAFNPWPCQGRLLIDGAVVNPMPASVLRDAGIRRVVGSSVAGQDAVTPGAAGRAPHLLEIVSRMLTSVERELIKAQVPLVDVLVRPRVSAAGTFDFSRFDAFVAEGERAAREHLDEIRALASSGAAPPG